MAVYKQPKSKNWWYKFNWNGEPIRESTKQTNKRVAEQMEAAHRTALAKGEVGIREKAKAPAFPELADRFLDWSRREHREHPATTAFYEDMVRSLLRYEPFRTIRIDKVDNDVRDAFIDHRLRCTRIKVIRRKKGAVEYRDSAKPISVATINRELATLRCMLNLAYEEWGLLTARPPKISKLQGEKERQQVVSQAEDELYLQCADPEHRVFALVALDSTIRPGENLAMRWENVHFTPAIDSKYGFIHMPEGGTKKRGRNIPMTPRVRAALLARHKEVGSPAAGWVFPAISGSGPLNYWTMKSRHDRTIARMKDQGVASSFCPYVLRHTGLTRLGESGSDVFAIQKIAGHTDIKMTSRYVHPTPPHIEQSFTKLNAYNAEKAAQRNTAKPDAEHELNSRKAG
jgi:integrase